MTKDLMFHSIVPAFFLVAACDIRIFRLKSHPMDEWCYQESHLLRIKCLDDWAIAEAG